MPNSIHAAWSRKGCNSSHRLIASWERYIPGWNQDTWFHTQRFWLYFPREASILSGSRKFLLSLGNFSHTWYLQIYNLNQSFSENLKQVLQYVWHVNIYERSDTIKMIEGKMNTIYWYKSPSFQILVKSTIHPLEQNHQNKIHSHCHNQYNLIIQNPINVLHISKFPTKFFSSFISKAHLESYAINNGFEFIKKTGLVYIKKKKNLNTIKKHKWMYFKMNPKFTISVAHTTKIPKPVIEI